MVELAQTVGLKGFLLHCGQFHRAPSVTKSSTIKLYRTNAIMSMGKAEFEYLYFEEKIKKTMNLFGYYYTFNIYSGQILFFDLNC